MVEKLNTNAKFEENGSKAGTITFEISKEEVAKGIDAAFNKVKNDVQIPGFRKGKVTKELFIQRFGEEALYEDALNAVLPANFDAAVSEVRINTVGQPEILPESLTKGGPWILKANVTLAPSVELGEYNGVSIEIPDTDVSDEEVNHELEHLRQTEAELVPVKEDEKAANGDTVVIDFVGSINGEHFDGGKAENFSLSLGSGQFIPGFEEQLVGHKAGEDVNVNVSFPENYQAADLAGKPALFEVKIHELKKLSLPELDDEFAKDVDTEVASLAELKVKTKDRLKEQKKQTALDEKETKAIQAAVDNAKLDMEIPSDLIENDVHRQLDGFFSNLQSQGISPDMYFQLTGSDEKNLHEQFEQEAPNRIKTNLVLEAIANKENINSTDEELEAEYERLAKEYNMTADKLKTLIASSMVEHDLRLQKAVNLVVENAKELKK
ncbi:MAG: trigger factor [Lactobacillaceae bacterium]|jgi:trigger factor|nr:trigger factor [Lactobacillaceae bacterium]